jgi:hypothetical protein
MEDLKTTGIRPRRLRELVRFIFRRWSEFSEDADGSLITIEEQDVNDFMRKEQDFLEGFFEQYLSNYAVKLLNSDAGLTSKMAKGHILVSDYQALSRASQLFCHMLATTSITVFAHETGAVEVLEPYPYAEGLAEFLQINKTSEKTYLAPGDDCEDSSARKPSGFAKVNNLSGEALQIAQIAWETPDAEYRGIAAQVESLVFNGLDPNKIAVVGMHPLWRTNITAYLKELELPVTTVNDKLSLRADIRDLEQSIALRVVTVLRLLANPKDSMSWRSWIGFGDYLAKSNVFVDERRHAQELSAEAVFFDTVSQWPGWHEKQEYLSSCADKKGKDLLAYLTGTLSQSVDGDVGIPYCLWPLLRLGEDASPASMIAWLEERQFIPCSTGKRGITVLAPNMLVGLDFDEVLAVGCVNGFYPQKDFFDLTRITVNQQKRIQQEDRRLLNVILNAANRCVTFSYFKSIKFIEADRLRIKTNRIIMQDNHRIAQVSLSEPVAKFLSTTEYISLPAAATP